MNRSKIKHLELSEKIIKLKQDKIFYGAVSYIEKKENFFKIFIDLFNHTTHEIDEELLFTGKLKGITYTLDLVIETPSLFILGHKNEIFKFTIVDKMETYFDTYEGMLFFNTNRIYDDLNPLKGERYLFNISKLSLEGKTKYREYIKRHTDYIEEHSHYKECLKMEDYHISSKPISNIQYSQYHVGMGNCTYINIGNISKGFFNLGYEVVDKTSGGMYTGFSRHKPDWVILSNLNKYSYNAAIRYGRTPIFSCDWIIPKVSNYNINIIRLLYCIILAGGSVYMLKYKANSAVCHYKKEDIKLEVYYTTEYDMNDNGLCLYLENKDKFISFGNSDYNFLTKSLIKQHFDLIVVPYQGSKMKTKIHLNKNYHLNYEYHRAGYNIHRTDLLGSFICKL
jgi:hypothetical protein